MKPQSPGAGHPNETSLRGSEEDPNATLVVLRRGGTRMMDRHDHQNEPSGDLQDEWDLYYARTAAEDKEENRVIKIGSFASMQLFYRYWDNLPLERLPTG